MINELLIGTVLFFCKAEPVSTNGDEYLKYNNMETEKACEVAVSECEKHYRNCEITACGEFKSDESLFEKNCDLTW